MFILQLYRFIKEPVPQDSEKKQEFASKLFVWRFYKAIREGICNARSNDVIIYYIYMYVIYMYMYTYKLYTINMYIIDFFITGKVLLRHVQEMLSLHHHVAHHNTNMMRKEWREVKHQPGRLEKPLIIKL